MIYDDGNCNRLEDKIWKAFLDLKALTARLRARWTASTFKRCQLRIVTDNKLPEDINVPDEVTQDWFDEQTRGAFDEKIDKSDRLAIFNRAVWIIYDHRRMAFRFPFRDELVVIEMPGYTPV